MATYERRKVRITSAELQKRFLGGNRRPLPGHEDDFPRWIWPYIRRAYLEGKLTEELKVPAGADIRDYSLPVVAFIKNAKIDFPGVQIAALPDNFLSSVKSAISEKLMDQYGSVVNPEDMERIPRPLWPYIRTNFRLGELANVKGVIVFDKDTLLELVGSVDKLERPGKPGRPSRPVKPLIDYPGSFPIPLIPKV